MESTQDRRRAFSVTDPVGLLTWLLILGGLLGIGLCVAGVTPLPGLFGGVCMLAMAWACVTQAERPRWRKQVAPLLAVSLALYVCAHVMFLSH